MSKNKYDLTPEEQAKKKEICRRRIEVTASVLTVIFMVASFAYFIYTLVEKFPD